MLDWLTDAAGPTYASAMLWTFGALILLLVVLLGIRVFKALTFGTYVAGGRQRRHRLAVSDAAAVDSHRRLVLVRRDDVEHLLLVGGPTDIVVEQNIRIGGEESAVRSLPQPARAAPAEPPAPPARPQTVAPRPAPSPQPAAPAPTRMREERQEAPAPRPVEPRPVPPRPQTATAAAEPPQPRPMPAPPPPRAAEQVARPPSPEGIGRPVPAQAAPRVDPPNREPAVPAPKQEPDDMDAALLDELEVTLEGRKAVKSTDPVDLALEDEMNKLLGELSEPRRG